MQVNTAYVDYVFHINTAVSDTAGQNLTVQFGDGDKALSSGLVLIAKIAFEASTEADHNAVLTQLTADDTPTYIYATPTPIAAVTEPETPTDAPDTTVDWWILPSAAFSIAVLLAVVLWAARKLMEKRAKVYHAKEAAYDRAAALENIHGRNARNLAASESFDDEGGATQTDADVSDGAGDSPDTAENTDGSAPANDDDAPTD